MYRWLKTRIRRAYLRDLKESIEQPPEHVAVIQDGNRRYARERGMESSSGHKHGAETTEDLLHWCEEVGIREITLYTFSTENFNRPQDELESLFDLISEKLYTFADETLVHENHVRIRALGDLHQLPDRVVDAIQYAEDQTEQYDQLQLNIALAYGGRNELLRAAKDIAHDVDNGELTPDDVCLSEIEDRLYREPIRDVDLIIRTGGDERTSNFLPWYGNGNEAAVCFCTPYWPEFNKVEFFRAIRTYESREESWQRDKNHRAIVLLRAIAESEFRDSKEAVNRVRDQLTGNNEKLNGVVTADGESRQNGSEYAQESDFSHD